MKNKLPHEFTLVITDNNRIFGTGSLFKNEICRFFILPEYQSKGYGKMLLKELEMHIEKDKYDNFALDASLGAVKFYQKNNYVYNDYKMIDLPGGNYLCYLEMIKKPSV
ncbi:MAG: GNAT family N-acetyltransferase [Treponema sp.]|nr:GNAT family N-acetyltransferase [Treponema sp.]